MCVDVIRRNQHDHICIGNYVNGSTIVVDRMLTKHNRRSDPLLPPKKGVLASVNANR